MSLAIRNYAAQGPLTAKLRSWFFHGAIFYPGFTVDAPTREKEREKKGERERDTACTDARGSSIRDTVSRCR